ncbi:MAG: hypothetical protein HYV28_19800 [Ignavibacteriales bacterium]|nr:hypothetical protein [Ignavibacteriales bacterium]
MNFKLIMNLSLFGLLAGSLNVFALTAGNDWVIWVLFWILASMLLKKKVAEKFFLHAFITGALFTLLAYFVQILLFDLYVANNPVIQSTISSLEPEVHPKTYFISIGLLLALGNGLILGLIALGLKRIK